MRVSGGESNGVSRISSSASVFQATGNGDQLATGAGQVDQVQA